jgi:lactam utilization protein B
MTEDLAAYDGKWVAMRDGRVVAHADEEEAVRAHAAVRETDLVFSIGEPPSGFYLINV